MATTYKGTLDRLMDENVLQGTSKTHDGHVAEAKHDFCICCTIPGIEHMNSWELYVNTRARCQSSALHSHSLAAPGLFLF